VSFTLLLGLLACGPKPDTVLTGLGNTNPAVREDMVKIARNYDDPRVVQALILALDDEEPVIRLNAVEALSWLKAVEATPALILRLEDPNDAVQLAAVDALGQLADPQATEPLMAFVSARLGDVIPLNALWALGNIGDTRAMDLLSHLRDHTDPYVSYNAHQALRRLKASASPTQEG